MKKFVTILAVFAMLASLLVVGVSAEQTNQEVIIPKFTAQPTFDGVVSEEEWGKPTVHMVTEGAATVEDNTIGENAEFGLKNIFYWFAYEGASDALSYDLWMRWDEKFFYIAAVVEDPDPFSLPKGGADIWCGDILQFYVDIKGPSACMLKVDPEFDYKTDAFLGARFNKPWSSNNVFNCILGLVQGKTETAWRCAGEWNLVTEAGASVGIKTVPHEDDTCTTTYEAAIPWSAIAASGTGVDKLDLEYTAKAGDVYGVCAVACITDSNSLNAWLQWGHGICAADPNSTQPRETRGGSQAMVLSADEFTPAAEYDKYVETTEAPTTEATEAPADSTAADTTAADGTATEEDGEKTEATTKAPDKDTKDEGGAPVGLIIGIAAAVIVVIAVIVIVVKKKK